MEDDQDKNKGELPAGDSEGGELEARESGPGELPSGEAVVDSTAETMEEPAAGEGSQPEEQPVAAAASTEGAGPRRLLRSSQDRMIAGVAGGLGRYFDIDPVIVRIAFAVSVLFGGLGIVAYIALALFVPSDGSPEPQAPAQRSLAAALGAIAFLALIAIPAIGGGILWGTGPGVLVWIGVPIVAAAALYLALRDSSWGPFGPPNREASAEGGVEGPGKAKGGAGSAIGGVLMALLVGAAAAIGFVVLLVGAAALAALGEGLAMAIGLAIAGIVLVVAALLGGGRWLILPVAALGLGVAVASASDVDLEGGVGERIKEPASAESIPAEGYRLGVGHLVVDLRGLEWRSQILDLDVRLGIGKATVLVPERVCVTADASVNAGSLDITGHRADGIEADIGPAEDLDAAPQLRLDGEVDLGVLNVINDDDTDARTAGYGYDNRADERRAREHNEIACSG
jgi:phage shock protein PspC (stress-responsive transcriptional regulator)